MLISAFRSHFNLQGAGWPRLAHMHTHTHTRHTLIINPIYFNKEALASLTLEHQASSLDLTEQLEEIREGTPNPLSLLTHDDRMTQLDMEARGIYLSSFLPLSFSQSPEQGLFQHPYQCTTISLLPPTPLLHQVSHPPLPQS